MASAHDPARRVFDAIIIGAGFAGLYQLHKLRDELGLSVRVLEKAPSVGGTWYWNRYPGARCDSESRVYCYSFSPSLARGWTWTERYPAQAEVLAYLEYVADQLALRPDIEFDSTVVAAEFDADAAQWVVTTSDGIVSRATWLITAVGCLSAANLPDIPGLADFAGPVLHSAAWPHEGVDFAGKRVGLIGTGSTGIQIAPVVAESAAELVVFQRTPNYSVPARNRPLEPDEQEQLRKTSAALKSAREATINGHIHAAPSCGAFDLDADERDRRYEAAWQAGGLSFRHTFSDILTDPLANQTAADFVRKKINAIVHDPAKASLLTAFDHPFAAKRPPVDTGYFETFNRANVRLVDIRNAPITAITAHGVRTTAGDHDLDMLIFATGFDAITGPLLRLGIKGRDSASLNSVWADGPQTWLGLMVSGFPNLFMITGPGSPSVLCNMPVPIEHHVEWITDAIKYARIHGVRTYEPPYEAMTAWSAEVAQAAGRTLLPQAASSWYLGANVAGKPVAFLPYAGGMPRYRASCDAEAQAGYPTLRQRSAPMPTQTPKLLQ